jgi:hypothetical protein
MWTMLVICIPIPTTSIRAKARQKDTGWYAIPLSENEMRLEA